MSRRAAGALVALAAIVLGAVAYFALRAPRSPLVSEDERADERIAGREAESTRSASDAAPSPEAAVAWNAELYFPSASDRLEAETRELAAGDTPVERARALLVSLLQTAPSAPRQPPFPAGVAPGTLLLLADGTLVVDLDPQASPDPPDSGSTVEELRVYAVVHTLLRNLPEAQRVVLLWNGRQRSSFAGHVDTARPLHLRTGLEAARPKAPAPDSPTTSE